MTVLLFETSRDTGAKRLRTPKNQVLLRFAPVSPKIRSGRFAGFAVTFIVAVTLPLPLPTTTDHTRMERMMTA
jgi:hypothetical protein